MKRWPTTGTWIGGSRRKTMRGKMFSARTSFTLSAFTLAVLSSAQPASETNAPARATDLASLERNGKREATPVHDPSTIVKCKDEYWFFATGPGVSSWRSKDLKRWERGPRV